MSNHHTMQLVQTHPTGAQEWRCPTCDRHFVMRLQPAYQRIILKEGDEYSSHSGSIGHVQISQTTLSPSDDMSAELRDALEDFLNGLDED